MRETPLFHGISQNSIDDMLLCFKPETRFFRKGDIILVYSTELEYLCVLLRGSAHLYCMDKEGEYTLLEQYADNDIFGEVFAMPYGELGYAVEADCDCEVMFIRFSCIYGRCPKACAHHSQLTRNLFELSAKKAQSLSLRINMISKRSLRRKLCTYFEYMQEKKGNNSFDIELSLSQLANFLCADRTSMMRELRHMSSEGLIERHGRHVTLLQHNN